MVWAVIFKFGVKIKRWLQDMAEEEDEFDICDLVTKRHSYCFTGNPLD